MVRDFGKLFASPKLAGLLTIVLVSFGLLAPLSAQDVSPSGAATTLCDEHASTSPAEMLPAASPIQPGQSAAGTESALDTSPGPPSQPDAPQSTCSAPAAVTLFSAYLSSPGYFFSPAFADSTFPQDSGAATLSKPKNEYPVSPDVGKWGGEQWRPAMLQALSFTLFQNGYRYATEAKTRAAVNRETWGRYWAAVTGLHTWSDGGKTWTVYVAHPAQGAVFVDIWTQHDPHGVLVPFGLNRPYWVSKAKAFWWNAAWELQWKFGPFSEASIGNVGLVPGKLGANTIVSTVTIGWGLAIGEDMVDRYAIAKWEKHTNNIYVRAALRTMLNPDRGFANLFRFHAPWYRDTRHMLTDLAP
jgi:hypothetical protein